MIQLRPRMLLVAAVLSALLAVPAAAQVSDLGSTAASAPATYGARGFYIEPFFSTCSIGGDFNGQTHLGDGSELFLMPKINSSSGLGIGAGYKTPGGSFGVYYFGSSHSMTATVLNYPSGYNGSYSAFGLLFTQQFGLNNRFQPYVTAGINMARVTVTGGAFTQTQIGDATFSGFGIDAGAGLLFYATPQIFVRAGLLYRETVFGWVKGLLDEAKPMSTLYLDFAQTQVATIRLAGGLAFMLSAGYTF